LTFNFIDIDYVFIHCSSVVLLQFAGVFPRTIQNLPDGTFDLTELRSLIRPLHDPHQPRTKLICLENSHNFCGGKALPMDFVKKVRASL